MIAFVADKNLKKGRFTHLQSPRCRSYHCNVSGCKKSFRSVDLPSPLEMLDDSGNEDTSQFYIEHIEGDNHDHDAVDLVSRGIFFEFEKKPNYFLSILEI